MPKPSFGVLGVKTFDGGFEYKLPALDVGRDLREDLGDLPAGPAFDDDPQELKPDESLEVAVIAGGGARDLPPRSERPSRAATTSVFPVGLSLSGTTASVLPRVHPGFPRTTSPGPSPAMGHHPGRFDPLLVRQRGRPGFPRRRRGRRCRSQLRLCPVFNEATERPRLATVTIRDAVESISPPSLVKERWREKATLPKGGHARRARP